MLRETPVAAELRAATAKPYAGMQISPEQGQLMALLVQAIGARSAIEIGTFTGQRAGSLCSARQTDDFCAAT
jgi:caffeoyl-CoA O-methyltransferase